MAVVDDLTALVAALPNAALLTDSMKQTALAGAAIPDGAGVWPGKPNYQPTYDIYFAAISLIGFLAAQPVVRQVGSEGTSVSVDAPNWAGLLAYYRSQSPISQATAGGVLNVLPIPDGPHVVPTNMTGLDSFGRREDYGDTDHI